MCIRDRNCYQVPDQVIAIYCTSWWQLQRSYATIRGIRRSAGSSWPQPIHFLIISDCRVAVQEEATHETKATSVYCGREPGSARDRFASKCIQSARSASSRPGRNTAGLSPVSYTHLRAHETPEHLVCRLL